LKLYLGKNFAENFEIANIPEWISVGPANGTFDELRVSDSVRYKEDFTPPTKAYEPDENTKILMHFDNNIDALGNSGQKIETSFDGKKNENFKPEDHEWGKK
jgi:hypothetical protein